MVGKHTPGPWKVTEGQRTLANVSATTKRGLTKSVAQVGGFFRDDREYNARLIAAAPELLEALQDAVEYLKNHLPDEVLASHRAAIAKATQP